MNKHSFKDISAVALKKLGKGNYQVDSIFHVSSYYVVQYTIKGNKKTIDNPFIKVSYPPKPGSQPIVSFVAPPMDFAGWKRRIELKEK